MKQSPQQRAKLRCCASCELIWTKESKEPESCPKCGFASYGARYVHGRKCYRYEVTQEPWIDRKVWALKFKLFDERNTTSPATVRHNLRQMTRGHSLSLND